MNMRVLYLGAIVLFLVLLAVIGLNIGIIDLPFNSLDGWRMTGQDISNCRYQPAERQIGTDNVHRLAAKWVFTSWSSVSATPTVAENALYFPDWEGNIYAVRASDGELLWSRKVSDYNGVAGSLSQVSPAIYADKLIFGDSRRSGAAPSGGARVIAVDRHSGSLRWITNVEANPAAIIAAAPVFYGNTVYVGVSSLEETLYRDPAYPCCSFRGSIVALDIYTGEIRWKRYTAPNRYSGNAIWAPPAIDSRRGSLYLGTGRNYTVPAEDLQCQ